MSKPPALHVELIYCADGNRRFAEIAIQQGFTYGAQLPNSVAYPPVFVDQNWKNPDRAAYIKALAKYKPRLATVLDWEYEEQLWEVLDWAEEAAKHVSECIIIIPKVMGKIGLVPGTIGGKSIRLGYSVPTSFGGTQLPLWEFGNRPVHLLGGSPKKQLELRNYLYVQSADGNYAQLMATRYGQFFACNGMARGEDRFWPRLSEVHPIGDDRPYHAFRLSCVNIRAAWAGCRAYLRYGTEADIPAIKRIANQYKNELGFVNSAALKASMIRYEVYVAEYLGEIVGFINWHHRRDGWNTIYEVAVDRNHRCHRIGRALVEAIPIPRRLKCTADNPANSFYRKMRMENVAEESGRNRILNVWESLV